ncbi:MAG: hypothetical protein KAI97_03785, partial [Gemmatimonadetes bacterium]|nr:hypothetical protein [Gemmatimonadota bacterium]
MRKAAKTLCVMLVIVPTAVCSPQEPEDPLLIELEANRGRWIGLGVMDYDLTLLRGCFCPIESIGPVMVRVRGGEIVFQTYTETGMPVPEQQKLFFPAVIGLFDVILQSIESGADHITVTYDSETGVPAEIFIDSIEGAVDDELRITVVEFSDG